MEIPIITKQHKPAVMKIQPKFTVDDLADVRTANNRLHEASNLPDLKKLLDVIWYENELHILYADTGLGKSIFAMNIAIALASGKSLMGLTNEMEAQPVLYYDFELSDRQFYTRFSNDQNQMFNFPPYLYIDTINFAMLGCISIDGDYTDILFQKIKLDIERTNAKIIIIDNMTYLKLASLQDKNASLQLMRMLTSLKNDLQMSILVIAHTPKVNSTLPITINELSGSKTLSIFTDSVSAIGKSSQGKSLRYLKQIKPSRSSEIVYDEDNVLVFELIKKDLILTVEYKDFGIEQEHLETRSLQEKQLERQEKRDKAKELFKQGKSYAEIAEEVLQDRNKKSMVYKWLNPK